MASSGCRKPWSTSWSPTGRWSPFRSGKLGKRESPNMRKIVKWKPHRSRTWPSWEMGFIMLHSEESETGGDIFSPLFDFFNRFFIGDKTCFLYIFRFAVSSVIVRRSNNRMLVRIAGFRHADSGNYTILVNILRWTDKTVPGCMVDELQHYYMKGSKHCFTSSSLCWGGALKSQETSISAARKKAIINGRSIRLRAYVNQTSIKEFLRTRMCFSKETRYS